MIVIPDNRVFREYLEGYATFQSHARRVVLNNKLALFDDGHLVGWHIGSVTDPARVETIGYQDSGWVCRMRNCMDLMVEVGCPDLRPEVGNAICPVCKGLGHIYDSDGDIITCRACFRY